MGNSFSFIIKHGRRLKNRYNAQYRALEFISKENLPSAPKHPVPHVGQIVQETSLFQGLEKKDLKLAEYLKDVYVQSHDKVPPDSHMSRNNPERPLPESREPKPKANFKEPEEVEKGWCTITEISEFIASHEEDKIANSSTVIAEKYNLEEKKVENTLKYFSVFRVFDIVRDTVPQEEEHQQFTLQKPAPTISELKKSLEERVGNGSGKEESHSESGERSEPLEKAIKN